MTAGTHVIEHPMGKHPVTVVIPSRSPDLNLWVKEALDTASPVETIISWNEQRTNPNILRNEGARKATQPYLFFMDDDVILTKNIFKSMLEKGSDWVYCDFIALNHPLHGHYIHNAGEYYHGREKSETFMSTMSLVRKSIFPGFDPNIERLQDADLWLTMVKAGHIPTYINEVLFAAYYGTRSPITKAVGFEEAWTILRKKHGF